MGSEPKLVLDNVSSGEVDTICLTAQDEACLKELRVERRVDVVEATCGQPSVPGAGQEGVLLTDEAVSEDSPATSLTAEQQRKQRRRVNNQASAKRKRIKQDEEIKAAVQRLEELKASETELTLFVGRAEANNRRLQREVAELNEGLLESLLVSTTLEKEVRKLRFTLAQGNVPLPERPTYSGRFLRGGPLSAPLGTTTQDQPLPPAPLPSSTTAGASGLDKVVHVPTQPPQMSQMGPPKPEGLDTAGSPQTSAPGAPHMLQPATHISCPPGKIPTHVRSFRKRSAKC